MIIKKFSSFNENLIDRDLVDETSNNVSGLPDRTYDTPNNIFSRVLSTSGLGKYDILYDSVILMYNSGDLNGIESLMDLSVESENRGYVRTMLIATKPIRNNGISSEKYDMLVNFLKTK